MKPFCPAWPMRRIISIQNAPMSAIGISQPSGVAPERALDDACRASRRARRGSFSRSGSSTRTVSNAVRLRPRPRRWSGCRLGRLRRAWPAAAGRPCLRLRGRACGACCWAPRRRGGGGLLHSSLDGGLADGDLLDLVLRDRDLEVAVRDPVRAQVGAQHLLDEQNSPKAQDEVAERKPELLLLAVHHSQTKTHIPVPETAPCCYRRWRARHAGVTAGPGRDGARAQTVARNVKEQTRGAHAVRQVDAPSRCRRSIRADAERGRDARALRAAAPARRRRDGAGVQGARGGPGRVQARRRRQADSPRVRPRLGVHPHVRRRGEAARPPAPPERRAGLRLRRGRRRRCSSRSSTSRALRCRGCCARCAAPTSGCRRRSRRSSRARSAARSPAYTSCATSRSGPLGAIHRDVTPSNVILTPAGEVKLLDFGVATFKNALQGTKSGTVKGKPAYLAPEQLEGKAIDGRVDLFALGIVMHEMLTLQHLFAGDSDLGTVKQIMEREIPRPSAQAERRAGGAGTNGDARAGTGSRAEVRDGGGDGARRWTTSSSHRSCTSARS